MTDLIDTLPPEQAAQAKSVGAQLMPLINRIPMKRWLAISRRYGVTAVDIQRNPAATMNELFLIAGNEVRRIQTGADAWDEVEEMGLGEISELIFDHLTALDTTDDEDLEADKSGSVGGDSPQPSQVQPGDGHAT